MLAGIPTLVWDKSLIVRECPELLRRTHNYNFAPRPIDGIVRIRLLRSNRYAIQSGRADYGLGLPHYGEQDRKLVSLGRDPGSPVWTCGATARLDAPRRSPCSVGSVPISLPNG